MGDAVLCGGVVDDNSVPPNAQAEKSMARLLVGHWGYCIAPSYLPPGEAFLDAADRGEVRRACLIVDIQLGD